MTKKISITGTESTGKTELAEKLAAHYQTVLVPDYSRIHIEQLNRPYIEEDVLEIARGIIEQEYEVKTGSVGKLFHHAPFVPLHFREGEGRGNIKVNDERVFLFFSDNDLINIKIWLQYYLWQVPEWLDEAIVKNKPDLYLLCDIDIPWVADEQRANPHDRENLFSRFVQELKAVNAPFRLVTGEDDERLQSAITWVDEWLRMK